VQHFYFACHAYICTNKINVTTKVLKRLTHHAFYETNISKVFTNVSYNYAIRATSTTCRPTRELGSFRSAGFLVSVQLVAELTLTAVPHQCVDTDVLTQARVEQTFVVIWLHNAPFSVSCIRFTH